MLPAAPDRAPLLSGAPLGPPADPDTKAELAAAIVAVFKRC